VTREHRMILQKPKIDHMTFCPDDRNLLFYAGPLTDRPWCVRVSDGVDWRLYVRENDQQWVTHESWLPGTGELLFVDWPRGMRALDLKTGRTRWVTKVNAWHAVSNRAGTLVVADTNFPDIGLVLFDPREECGPVRTLCHTKSSNQGAHWAGPFPYNRGPIKVNAHQHTHPHPSFSPDGKFAVFTSDRTGFSQIYEVEIA